MKPIYVMLIFSALIFGCKSDDDAPIDPGSGGGGGGSTLDITGTWIANEMTFSVNSIQTANNQSTTVQYMGEVSDVDFTVTYDEDPNVSTSDGTYDLVLTSEVNGETNTETFDDIDYRIVGSWSLQGSTLRISNNFSATTAQIFELTDTTFAYTYETIEEFVEDGITYLNTTTSTIRFTK